jgi:hypothetical protein
MPAVKVFTKKMEPPIKEGIAKQFLNTLQEYLKVPIAEIFFFDVDIYGTDEGEHCLLEVEGPERPAEVIEQLGRSLCAAFSGGSGRECHVSVIYHVNQPTHIIEAEGALSSMLKTPHRGF